MKKLFTGLLLLLTVPIFGQLYSGPFKADGSNLPPGAVTQNYNRTTTFNSTVNMTSSLAVDTNTLFVDAPNNRVGIGTTSPGTNLEVLGAPPTLYVNASTGSPRVLINSPSGQDTRIVLTENGTSQWAIGHFTTGGPLMFSQAGDLSNPKVTFLQNGQVGIGTTTPATALSVVGTVNATTGFTGVLGSDTSINYAQFQLPVNVQTGTSYTLTAADSGKLLTFNNASAITLTLPQQSTTATNAGYSVRVKNLGAGLVTIVKQGAETLDGNTSIAQYATAIIDRPTTTKWAVFGGTATINRPGIHQSIATLTTSQTRYLVGYAGSGFTILGFYQRARALTTAGTFAVQRNGVTIQGLAAIVPSTAGSYTAVTTATNNVVVRGDQITIVADGTLVGVLDLGTSIDLTEQF